ncbi:MAG: phosphopantetheine-binding protein, partial [Blastocatellia bacterium]
DRLPLTMNGKVDRRRLPILETWFSQETYVAPRTPTEQALCEIWQAVLGVERIGIHDNFFRLGGHSLLAMVLISRAREAFDLELPSIALFESPTVASLGEVVDFSIIRQDPVEMADWIDV